MMDYKLATLFFSVFVTIVIAALISWMFSALSGLPFWGIFNISWFGAVAIDLIVFAIRGLRDSK